MAAAIQSFLFTVRSCGCRHGIHRHATKSIGRRRPFSTAPPRWHEQDRSESSKRAILDKIERASGANRGKWLESQVSSFDEQMKEEEEAAKEFLLRNSSAPSFEWEKRRAPKIKPSFLNMGERELIDGHPDDESEEDDEDLTTLGHGELEHHREMRHYARLAAWEMPLLSTMAKPFEPPTADMPLRFRYTTYLGEQHPAEKKVVLEFCPEDMLDLTAVQREKLRKLVGVRYNPETDIVKMSCEMFESQAQNKRYLGDLVDTLLQEAKDPTDTFEDIPLDTRHHKFKPKPKFPREWVLTEERRAELAAYRQNAAMKDQELMFTGQLVDGIKQIEEAFARPAPTREALPEMASAAKGAKGKGGRVTVRR